MCAMASNTVLLVMFRVIQGLGGAILLPLTFINVTREAGPKRIGRLMMVLGIPMLLPAVFAPVLGGWLIGSFGWRWIFLINPHLPTGICTGGRHLPDRRALGRGVPRLHRLAATVAKPCNIALWHILNTGARHDT
ncbi:MAG: MFS transporter [Mycobacterium sp.]|nr:MFS transporter [Mycobacterium sp.]